MLSDYRVTVLVFCLFSTSIFKISHIHLLSPQFVMSGHSLSPPPPLPTVLPGPPCSAHSLTYSSAPAITLIIQVSQTLPVSQLLSDLDLRPFGVVSSP